jgi:hypothetical protein
MASPSAIAWQMMILSKGSLGIREAGKLQNCRFNGRQRFNLMTGAPVMDEIGRSFRNIKLAQSLLDDNRQSGCDSW